MADRLDRFVGELAAVMLQALQAGIERAPGDRTLAVVSLFDGGLDDVLHWRGDVQADAVAAQDADDRTVADDQLATLGFDEVALGDLDFFELGHSLPPR